MNQEDAVRQVYGRLAHAGLNVEKIKLRNPPLHSLEILADTVEQHWKEWKELPEDDEARKADKLHKKNLERDHELWREAGLTRCFVCPCSLEGVEV